MAEVVADSGGQVAARSSAAARGRGAGALCLFLLSLLCWAFASPVGSAPDDDYHIANIYCLSDQNSCRSLDATWPEGQPGWPADPLDRRYEPWKDLQKVYPDLWSFSAPRQFPCFILNGSTAYNADPARPADCLSAEDQANNTPRSVDNVQYYPSLAYRFLSVFTQDTIRKSVAAWRTAVVVGAVVMAGLSIWLSLARWRRPLLMTWIVCSIPLGAFLLSSHNPSAWAVIGTVAMVGPGVAVLQEPSRDRLSVARVGVVLLCLVMVLGSRSEGILFVAVGLALVSVFGLTGRSLTKVAIAAGLAAVPVALLLTWAGGWSSLSARLGQTYLAPTGGSRLWETLMEAPLSLAAYSTRLGWLEIPMPQAVMIPAGAAFFGAVFLGLARVDGRKVGALVLTLLAPIVSTTVVGVISGAGLQHRYYLPLIYLFMLAALAPVGPVPLPVWSRAQWVALCACLVLANSIALLYVELRYVTGINEAASPAALLTAATPDWWWHVWLNPFVNWVVGSISFPLALLTVLPLIRRWDRAVVHTEAGSREARAEASSSGRERSHRSNGDGNGKAREGSWGPHEPPHDAAAPPSDSPSVT